MLIHEKTNELGLFYLTFEWSVNNEVEICLKKWDATEICYTHLWTNSLQIVF